MDVFEYYTGQVATNKSNQNVIDCPCCKKEQHFYYDSKTFLWECKVCGEQGNVYSFIRKLHETLLPGSAKGVMHLATSRQIPVGIVSESQIVYDPSQKIWFVFFT